MVDDAWVEQVCTTCDQVFDAVDVGFVGQVLRSGPGDAPAIALLWEADPQRFAERYPDSGIVESYGGPEAYVGVHCIDYWVYLDGPDDHCRLSVEGWSWPELLVPITGQADLDAAAIADAFARILRVPPPGI
jgi:hypothetical protein